MIGAKSEIEIVTISSNFIYLYGKDERIINVSLLDLHFCFKWITTSL